jgi:hypothetical protein
MKKTRNIPIVVRIDLSVYKELKKQSLEREIAISSHIRNILVKNYNKYRNLNKLEKEYSKFLKDEIDIGMIKELRKNSFAKMTMLKNIEKVIYIAKQGNMIYKEDLLKNLDYSLKICIKKKWEDERKMLEDLINDFKSKPEIMFDARNVVRTIQFQEKLIEDVK